ncbi:MULTISPECIES: sensor histidine kinase [Actinokineospora]|nr:MULTISPECIES: sensor histidine kinase [Actinokineospora]
MAGDAHIAVAIALFELPLIAAMASGWHTAILILVGIGLTAPLVIRRRNPLLSAYLVLAAGAVQLFTHGEGSDDTPDLRLRVADMALGISLYTLVAYVGRRQAALYAVGLAIGTGAWAFWRFSGMEPLIMVTFAAIIFALCWVLGEFAGARRAYHVEVERRLALLETERDHQARIAVGEERARIARELHDVVAHAVSVMVVQSEGAAYAVRTDPDMAEQAIRTVAQTGRDALTELRRLLGVLRSDAAETGRAPQPGAQSISELAERVRAVGVPVVLELTGELDDLPAGVGLGVYRIVQEALTNTIKHAGPGASAAVRVKRDGDQVELDITDRGRGAKRGLASGGNGLIGMRERAHVFGGSLEAGPLPTGGWRVHAVLPVTAA